MGGWDSKWAGLQMSGTVSITTSLSNYKLQLQLLPYVIVMYHIAGPNVLRSSISALNSCHSYCADVLKLYRLAGWLPKSGMEYYIYISLIYKCVV